MKKSFGVRLMRGNELDLLYQQAQNENWDPGVFDFNAYFSSCPEGFFVGVIDDIPICFVSIVQYEKHFAFFGNYIVIPEYRHQGFGYELVKKVSSRLENRISALDAVVDQISTYEKSGFISDGYNIRYQGIAKNYAKNNKLIVDLKNINFNEICEYDRKHFLADRSAFLKEWIYHTSSYGFACINDEKIMGYCVLRKTTSGYRIAPLFADSIEIAKDLMSFSLSCIVGKIFTINMPFKNANLENFISTFSLQPIFKTMRMYRNGKLELPLNNIYSISSFELG